MHIVVFFYVYFVLFCRYVFPPHNSPTAPQPNSPTTQQPHNTTTTQATQQPYVLYVCVHKPPSREKRVTRGEFFVSAPSLEASWTAPARRCTAPRPGICRCTWRRCWAARASPRRTRGTPGLAGLVGPPGGGGFALVAVFVGRGGKKGGRRLLGDPLVVKNESERKPTSLFWGGSRGLHLKTNPFCLCWRVLILAWFKEKPW